MGFNPSIYQRYAFRALSPNSGLFRHPLKPLMEQLESVVKYTEAQKRKTGRPSPWVWDFFESQCRECPRSPGDTAKLSGTQRSRRFDIAVRCRMRSVNVAELKNQLSKYLTFARSGEEIVIRDRNLPGAKLIPFSAGDASDEELLLVAAGKMRLPTPIRESQFPFSRPPSFRKREGARLFRRRTLVSFQDSINYSRDDAPASGPATFPARLDRKLGKVPHRR
jgi:antitoxin (DNA-binding transcriptional repressor) of toxin-antitoxin stability system